MFKVRNRQNIHSIKAKKMKNSLICLHDPLKDLHDYIMVFRFEMIANDNTHKKNGQIKIQRMPRTCRFFVVYKKAGRCLDSDVHQALWWNELFHHRTCTIFRWLSRSSYSVHLFRFRFHNGPRFHIVRICRWILEVRILMEWLLWFLICGKFCLCSRIALSGA